MHDPWLWRRDIRLSLRALSSWDLRDEGRDLPALPSRLVLRTGWEHRMHALSARHVFNRPAGQHVYRLRGGQVRGRHWAERVRDLRSWEVFIVLLTDPVQRVHPLPGWEHVQRQ